MGSETKSGQDVVTLDLFFDQDGYSRQYYSLQINVPVIRSDDDKRVFAEIYYGI